MEDKLLMSFYESFQSVTEWDEVFVSNDRIEAKILERIQKAINANEIRDLPIK